MHRSRSFIHKRIHTSRWEIRFSFQDFPTYHRNRKKARIVEKNYCLEGGWSGRDFNGWLESRRFPLLRWNGVSSSVTEIALLFNLRLRICIESPISSKRGRGGKGKRGRGGEREGREEVFEEWKKRGEELLTNNLAAIWRFNATTTKHSRNWRTTRGEEIYSLRSSSSPPPSPSFPLLLF